ncbi:hypothetical protein [Pseudonocardia sp. WMMC193]|uniref:hypothetical protein n=1 Tax=Pseudonocardia sp. WMMC193 TaxID=2911965 RepID=UPI001F21C847|nr:hypothetical protein [Pseudonocardia sp. WMMC193]MCF7552653.1 hypothetical protein [Pseudonocardia sp. WMMC193]
MITTPPFRPVTVGDAVVAYLTSTACRHLHTRRERAGALGPLADQIGIDLPLTELNCRDISAAVSALVATSERIDHHRARAAVEHWLQWCSSTVGWPTPTLDHLSLQG